MGSIRYKALLTKRYMYKIHFIKGQIFNKLIMEVFREEYK